ALWEGGGDRRDERARAGHERRPRAAPVVAASVPQCRDRHGAGLSDAPGLRQGGCGDLDARAGRGARALASRHHRGGTTESQQSVPAQLPDAAGIGGDDAFRELLAGAAARRRHAYARGELLASGTSAHARGAALERGAQRAALAGLTATLPTPARGGRSSPTICNRALRLRPARSPQAAIAARIEP